MKWDWIDIDQADQMNDYSPSDMLQINNKDIAIIGMDCRLSHLKKTEIWDFLANGANGIKALHSTRKEQIFNVMRERDSRNPSMNMVLVDTLKK